jgi:hypothetical protein
MVSEIGTLKWVNRIDLLCKHHWLYPLLLRFGSVLSAGLLRLRGRVGRRATRRGRWSAFVFKLPRLVSDIESRVLGRSTHGCEYLVSAFVTCILIYAITYIQSVCPAKESRSIQDDGVGSDSRVLDKSNTKQAYECGDPSCKERSTQRLFGCGERVCNE